MTSAFREQSISFFLFSFPCKPYILNNYFFFLLLTFSGNLLIDLVLDAHSLAILGLVANINLACAFDLNGLININRRYHRDQVFSRTWNISISTQKAIPHKSHLPCSKEILERTKFPPRCWLT